MPTIDDRASRLLLYGANGYTGRLTAALAAAKGLDVVLAGRSAEPIRRLGEQLRLPTRVVGLDDPGALANALADVATVVHVAGPFAVTSAPMLRACLATGTNYVDITGEIEVFEAIWSRAGEIRGAGITVVPGAGFDVVPSDCLAGYVAGQLERPTSLIIALRGLERASRGTMTTAIGQLSASVLCRRGGAIVPLDDRSEREIDFGDGPEPCVPLSWGDVATAFHSTGVPNVTVYLRRTGLLRSANVAGRLFGPLLRSRFGRRALAALVRRAPDGPSAAERRRHRSVVWARATNDAGESVTATLSTPDPYDLTANSVLEVAARVSALRHPLGLATPFQAFGADLVLALPGCERSAPVKSRALRSR